ncbi:hypothetical protein [Achromobacter aloeverae]|uniref:MarR family transcriptional regulator n=1 Tax=Achromobacter aloeverae TaxID=1750518 RepID=A0A4Q1HIE0_9BURK|nr:hypothetical protein [Achromobacter aloeverae]RXN88002.1 hypothetical protein C7R54_15610 [Achromobacter aloeverae]
MSKATERKILMLLRERGELAQYQIIDLSGESYNPVIKALTSLHNHKRIHISDWERNRNGNYGASWSLGENDDAPRPKGDRPKTDHIKAIMSAICGMEVSPFRTAIWNVERAR